MAYYYINSNDQDYYYPPNYPYYNCNQPYNSEHHHNYYSSNSSSSSYDHHQYAANYAYNYSNIEPPTIRYDHDHQYYDNQYYDHQYYGTQFHSNSYQHFPARSLTVYQYNSTYDHPELPLKAGPNCLDLVSTTGFVVSYSNTEPKEAETELEFEDYNPEPFHGGYNMDETYGKALPPSEDICHPPSKLDPTPPPPPSSLQNLSPVTPAVKEADKEQEQDKPEEEEEDEGSDSEEDEEEGEEREEEGNRGVLIPPPLPEKEEQQVDAKSGNEIIAKEAPMVEEEEEEEEEAGERRDNQEEQIIRRQIPPGYGLEAYNLCDAVFGGYFPCLRKRYGQVNVDQIQSSGGGDYANPSNYEDDCWRKTMDYLFGDPDPYARALPDPIYGYYKHYPQQPVVVYDQVQYGGDFHSWSEDYSSYYGYQYGG